MGALTRRLAVLLFVVLTSAAAGAAAQSGRSEWWIYGVLAASLATAAMVVWTGDVIGR